MKHVGSNLKVNILLNSIHRLSLCPQPLDLKHPQLGLLVQQLMVDQVLDIQLHKTAINKQQQQLHKTNLLIMAQKKVAN